MTREELATTYGATREDIDKVTQFAHDHHLHVEETSSAKRMVVVSGAVADMNRAFAVELSRYASPDFTYQAPTGLVYVPAELADIIVGVLGLDNRPVVRPHLAFATNDAVAAAAPVGAVPLTPPRVAHLYNFPTGKATGQTVGILTFGGGFAVDPDTKRATDVDTFCTNLGLGTPPSVTAVLLPGGANALSATKDTFFVFDLSKNPPLNVDIEVALDLEIIAAVAQDAKIVVYFAPNTSDGFYQAVMGAVQDCVNCPDALSISWGGAELTSWSPMDINTVSMAFQDAFLVGMSVFASSGDDGSDCGVGDGCAHVEYPGSDPYVVCCGGTTIANVAGSTFHEGTWNDPAGATGGGVSDHFCAQAWQAAAHVPPSANPGHRVGRGVPDVAGNASPHSGYDLWLYGTQLSKLVIKSGISVGCSGAIAAGTSAVAPLYAALAALLNAAWGSCFPFLNPVLYSLIGSAALRDINDGKNNQCSAAATPAPSYTSGPGWDGCTGLGVVDGTKLSESL
jgi:kumamolisin